MKKCFNFINSILSVISMLSIFTFMVSCDDGDISSDIQPSVNNIFKLSVIDEGNWLIYDRDDVYEVDDIIKFHTYVHPIKIDMYVDGEFYSSGTRVSLNENDDYIEYKIGRAHV